MDIQKSSVRLCRECRWFKANDGWNPGTCLHRAAASPTSLRQADCVDMRERRNLFLNETREGACGADGKLWEPRRTLWQALRATFSSDAGRA
jgi:hypothetical protein